MTTIRARWKLVAGGIVAVAAAGVILSLTAWDSSGSGTSTADSQTTAALDPEQAMLDFAQCMRDNGVPNFSDPVARPDASFGFERPQGVPSSALDDALERCQSELRATGIPLGPGPVRAGHGDAGRAARVLPMHAREWRRRIPRPEAEQRLAWRLAWALRRRGSTVAAVMQAMQSCQSVLNQALAPLHGGN